MPSARPLASALACTAMIHFRDGRAEAATALLAEATAVVGRLSPLRAADAQPLLQEARALIEAR